MLWAIRKRAGPDITVPKFPVPRIHCLNLPEIKPHLAIFTPASVTDNFPLTVLQSPQALCTVWSVCKLFPRET